MRRKVLYILTLITANISAVAAVNQGFHMTDGVMWGVHWTGSLLMIALLALVILGIIYLSQQIVQNSRGEKK